MYTALIDETKKFFSQPVELHNSKIFVGRSPQSDLVIKDKQISLAHCELDLCKNSWFIYNQTQISNTIKVNGISLAKYGCVHLQDGDRIDLNDAVTFLFVHRENLDKSSNTDSKPVMNGNTRQDKKRCGVSENDIGSKKAKIENGIKEELVCSVCCELFVKATTLRCSHTYCKFCITKWIKRHALCPVCCARITTMHPSIVINNLVAKIIEFADEETKNLREQLVQERERLDAENTVGVRLSKSKQVEVHSSSDDVDSS